MHHQHHSCLQALVVYDVDGDKNAMLSMTIECNEGALVLGDSTGLAFRDDTSENDTDLSDTASRRETPLPTSLLQFNGTAAAINHAMRNLRYRGLPGRVGQDVIRISITDDPGPCPGDFNISLSEFNATAAAPCALGGPQTAEAAIQVFLAAVNHPPSVDIPPQGPNTRTVVDAEYAVNIGNNGALSVEDPDVRETVYYSAGGLKIEGPLSVAVVVESGRLSLGARGGLSFSEGNGLSDTVLRFSGGIDDANRALATLSYLCSSSNGCGAGTHIVSVTVDDNGFTGVGGPMAANGTFEVQVSLASEIVLDEYSKSQ